MKDKTYHAYLDSHERQLVIHSLVVGAVVFLALMIFSSVFVIWQMKTNEFGGLIDRIEEVFYGTPFKNAYNAKSLILVDLSNDEVFISKRENEQQLPASLAKLFVIKYAVTLADLDSIVSANYEAISLTKSGSSVANIKTKEYYLQNLFAAMLVPSGNDAAYVVADYCGGLLSPQAKNSQERINAFMEHLNDYLQEQGYDDTVLYDPSGFDTEARTTALDLKKVVESLLEYQWFRDIVSKSSYKATLPDESTQMWKNTNAFLDSTSDYYNGNVKGVKTGSLSDDYNLVVLYQQHGKEFLICSLDEMGTLISPHYLTASFPKLLEKNNLRHIRFHDLRHSCASLLLANGVPMKQIQEWLGHSDFSTTANVYAHLDYNSKLSSADAMVNGLSGALEVIS